MKINREIVQLSAKYVRDYLDKQLPATYCYHNIFHSITVVNTIDEISETMKIEEHDRQILLTAGWFHDAGYIWQIEEHEIAGASLAEAFLREKQVDKADIEEVKKYIMATRYPQKPANNLEKIIGDADMIHLGKKDFLEKTDLIRSEWSATRKMEFSDAEWYQSNLSFLNAHEFHTEYCKKNYTVQKQKNIKQIEKMLEKETADANNLSVTDSNSNKKTKLLKKEKANRGVETLFKTASRNHMEIKQHG